MKWRGNGERREGGKYEYEGTRSDSRESERVRQMAEVIQEYCRAGGRAQASVT